MHTTPRAAGLGLLAYGIGTPIAFFTIGSPGGNYDDRTVASYMDTGHLATAIALAYLGSFTALGLLPFANHMRHQMSTGGDALWALAVAGTSAGVIDWFLVGGLAVAFAEGGKPVGSAPHAVVYLLGEMSNLIAVCASAFFVGALALLLAAKAALPRWLKTVTYIAGACGLLAAVFFPLFLFWLWAIWVGVWIMRHRSPWHAAAVTQDASAA